MMNLRKRSSHPRRSFARSFAATAKAPQLNTNLRGRRERARHVPRKAEAPAEMGLFRRRDV